MRHALTVAMVVIACRANAAPSKAHGTVVDEAGHIVPDARLYFWRPPSTSTLDAQSFVAVGEFGRDAVPTSSIGLNRPCSPMDLDPIGTYVIGEGRKRVIGEHDGSFIATLTNDPGWVVYATDGARSSGVMGVGTGTTKLVVRASPPVHGVILDGVGPLRATMCVVTPGVHGCVARGASDIWGRFYIDDVPQGALELAVHTVDADTRSRHEVERGEKAIVVRSVKSGVRHATGVVEGNASPGHGVIELVEAEPKTDFGDKAQVRVGGFDSGTLEDEHPFTVVNAAPIDSDGHYRIIDVPPGRYRALYVDLDDMQLLPRVIDVDGKRPAQMPSYPIVKPHAIDLSVLRERDEPVKFETLGVFVGDDRPRWLIGLIEYEAHETTLQATPNTWVWPMRPQMFYSANAQFVDRYAKPVRVGDSNKLTLHVTRAAADEHGCKTEGPGL